MMFPAIGALALSRGEEQGISSEHEADLQRGNAWSIPSWDREDLRDLLP
jgi:hypothetical protein